MAFEIDTEIRKIIDTEYKVATKIIKENRDLLDLIANTLLEYETITKEQIDFLAEHKRMPEDDELEDKYDSEEETKNEKK